jgi:uncharacterized protein
MIDWLLLGALVLLAAGGIVLAVFQLPGTWLILASAAVYDWHYAWQRIGWKWLVCLLVLATLAELLDTLASLVAARRAGASRRAAVGALLGGLIGMIVLSIPVPVIGTVVGGFIGCFVGALIGELTVRDDLAAGVKVGVFATLGRLIGLMAKTAAALAIAGATLLLAVRAAL